MEGCLDVRVINDIIRRLSVVDCCLVVAQYGLISDKIGLIRLQKISDSFIYSSVSGSNPRSIRSTAREPRYNQNRLKDHQSCHRREPNPRTPETIWIQNHLFLGLLYTLHEQVSSFFLPQPIINLKSRQAHIYLLSSNEYFVWIFKLFEINTN